MNTHFFRPGLLTKIGITAALVAASVALAIHIVHLDREIRSKFDGKRWSLPAEVYARALELYPGLDLAPEKLEQELQLAGYRKEEQVSAPGGYDRQGTVMHLETRGFYFPDGPEPPARLSIIFSDNRVRNLTDTSSREEVAIARLDPARIGSFHPTQHEDRIVLSRQELPELLVKTLLAIEDQNFFSHSGLSPAGILRAMVANIKAGATVQGGSTLSQQLVKNFFLSSQRSLRRKINEAIMALLLEYHYSKDEILTAYVNEIFLGQDGDRAIHGFGLASLYYFRRDLVDLSPAQMALLVGILKGPSSYNPVKFPERALERRQVVLGVMRAQSVIDEAAFQTALTTPLNESSGIVRGFNRFPSFLDLVRRQLSDDYREQDLTTDGLKILTTLDPQVQWQVEKDLDATIAALEKQTGKTGLEGAVIISSRGNGEILAMAGGRKPLQSGFNRAVDAKRSIGSLIKPAVFLRALQNGKTLASPIEDRALILDEDNTGSKRWSPENYDKKEHGRVALYQAFAHSYNLATIRLGLEIGVDKVVQTVRNLGVDRDFAPYPSFLLGSAEMSPLEVSQMYLTLAAGGFHIPQRVIGSVLGTDNKILKRFGLQVEQRVSPEIVFLVDHGMQRVVSEGTGRSLSKILPASYQLAGKTGTSNDLRDSWFAGFTGDKVGVVWLGKDDNSPTGLTGASGAMVTWGQIMRGINAQPLELIEPPGIEWGWIDPETLDSSSSFSDKSVKLPFIKAETVNPSQSAPQLPPALEKWGKGLRDTIRSWFD